MRFEQVIQELAPPPANHTRVYRVEHRSNPMSGGFSLACGNWGTPAYTKGGLPKGTYENGTCVCCHAFAVQ